MVDAASGTDGEDADAITRLSEADAQIVLEAVDGAFQHTLHGRYGGGVLVILKRDGNIVCEQPLRDVPVGLSDAIVLELEVRGAGGVAGFSAGSAGSLTALGTVSMLASPGRGADDVHVLTEVFDEHDPNGAADDGCLTTGILLSQEPQGLAGQMPGRGVFVVRSEDAQQSAGAAVRQGQRGWGAPSTRTKVNRGGGLGSNGHRRAATPQLVAPVSRALLKHIADHVATAKSVGRLVRRVVVGLKLNEFGLS